MSSKPQEHEYGIEALTRISKLVADHMVRATKCCPNCENFSHDRREVCQLNNMRPPAVIIAFGCECFVECDIPF